MTTLREALAEAIGASEFHDLLPRGCIFHHNDAAEAAERVFRDFWNAHRDAFLQAGKEHIYTEHEGYWAANFEAHLLGLFLDGVERALFGAPTQGQP